ncbi:3-oxoacyl-(acyl-carrier-protein) synthase [Paraburkholderia terricola]|uniref:beta-ketoacyl-[acyl-carrier-protein] synthase family protein n=1 Tax=Paraburkholderia terricola TaxID=169427 RepID=UPI0028553EFC|nr:beta-ketoacyl-[acyl-carrier-protein] synthase family protein [Paraburkholderia terricola]MDR6450038.1 3-oxoacyl-(acyl-carrier-protein) synthase [Paraburkholderia terricola]
MDHSLLPPSDPFAIVPQGASGESVWVTGVGIVSSLGCNFSDFSAAIRAGRCGATVASAAFGHAKSALEMPVYKVNGFDPADHFDIDAHATMDPLVQFSLVAAREAVAMAGLAAGDVDPARAGICFGTAGGATHNRLRYGREIASGDMSNGSLMQDFPYHSACAHIMNEFGWSGSSLTISSSCASASVAIGKAYEAIRCGQADVMICGGAEFLGPISMAIMNSTRLLTKDAMRPFDETRTGFALGEGAGLICLESERHWRARQATALCKLSGWGMAAEAYDPRTPEPTGRWQALAMTRALESARVDASAIQYINLNGNATEHDVSEVRAMRKVFGERYRRIPTSATKPMYGYLLGANGAVDAISVIAGMRQKFMPPTINLAKQDARCDIDCVPGTAAREASFQTALSLNAGLGGICCALILQDPAVPSRNHP